MSKLSDLFGKKKADDFIINDVFISIGAAVFYDQPSDSIGFNVGEKQILLLESNGDILVHGKLIENDIEVVEALREFIKSGLKTE